MKEINSTESFRFNNNFLYHYVYNHQNIDKKYILEQEFDGDGNCFFRNVSYFFTHKQIYHLFFREILFNYVIENQNKIILEFPKLIIKDKLINTNDYIPKISQYGNYSTEFEISKIVNIMKLNIAVYTKEIINNNKINSKFHSYFSEPNTEFKRNLMIILYNPHNEHYTQLYYNNYYKNSIIKNNSVIFNNTPKIANDLSIKDNLSFQENNLLIEIKNLIKKYTKLNLNDKSDIKKIKLNTKCDFNEKLKLGYNYPKIKNHKHGEFILLYVRDYLISKKISKFNPKYPDYIYENENSIDTQKRYFRTLANKYELDINNNLYIKYYPDKKNKINYELKIVPFTNNLKDYLLKIHSEDQHRNALSLRKALLSRNIFYYGITEDTIKFIKECPICNIKINYKDKSKREATKLPLI